jgi:hypothetical protein
LVIEKNGRKVKFRGDRIGEKKNSTMTRLHGCRRSLPGIAVGREWPKR